LKAKEVLGNLCVSFFFANLWVCLLTPLWGLWSKVYFKGKDELGERFSITQVSSNML